MFRRLYQTARTNVNKESVVKHVKSIKKTNPLDVYAYGAVASTLFFGQWIVRDVFMPDFKNFQARVREWDDPRVMKVTSTVGFVVFKGTKVAIVSGVMGVCWPISVPIAALSS